MADQSKGKFSKLTKAAKRRRFDDKESDFTKTFGVLPNVAVLETIVTEKRISLTELMFRMEIKYRFSPQSVINALRFCIRNSLAYIYVNNSKTMIRAASNNKNMNKIINLTVIWDRENAKRLDPLSYL